MVSLNNLKRQNEKVVPATIAPPDLNSWYLISIYTGNQIQNETKNPDEYDWEENPILGLF